VSWRLPPNFRPEGVQKTVDRYSISFAIIISREE
jgi:hypothetical protein